MQSEAGNRALNLTWESERPFKRDTFYLPFLYEKVLAVNATRSLSPVLRQSMDTFKPLLLRLTCKNAFLLKGEV